MNVRQLISRRSVAVIAGLVGMVSLAIGAHAALNKRALDAAKAIGTEQSADAAHKQPRLALVIGNGQYSVLVTELLNHLNSQSGAASAFNKTRISVSRASDGEQVPSVSSSLLDEIRIGG